MKMENEKKSNILTLSAVGGLCAGLLFLDWLTPLDVSVWLAYILPVMLASTLRNPIFSFLTTTLCSVLVFLGDIFTPLYANPASILINRVVVVAILWIVAILLERQRQARQDLLRAKNELEIRVQERTQDLAETNKTLETEIDERKQIEKDLKLTADELSRSNKDLEHFAYMASHDLQEPLRAIRGHLQLLTRAYKGKLGTDADDYIHYAVDGAKRMSDVIDSLLTYSRVGRDEKPLRPVNAEISLRHALQVLDDVIHANGAIVTNDPLPTVMADEIQLAQVFQNLIGNGIKFHREAPPRIHISAKKEDKAWLFSVQDNGIGIEPEYKEKIFKIFTRLHGVSEYPGSGIGLAICKRVIERFGGEICLESEVGKGTAFLFKLPDAEPNAQYKIFLILLKSQTT